MKLYIIITIQIKAAATEKKEYITKRHKTIVKAFENTFSKMRSL